MLLQFLLGQLVSWFNESLICRHIECVMFSIFSSTWRLVSVSLGRDVSFITLLIVLHQQKSKFNSRLWSSLLQDCLEERYGLVLEIKHGNIYVVCTERRSLFLWEAVCCDAYPSNLNTVCSFWGACYDRLTCEAHWDGFKHSPLFGWRCYVSCIMTCESMLHKLIWRDVVLFPHFSGH